MKEEIIRLEMVWAPTIVSVRVSIAVKRHHDQGNSFRGQHLIGAGLQVQRFSPSSSRREYDSIQAVIVKKELRVLYLHSNKVRRRLSPK